VLNKSTESQTKSFNQKPSNFVPVMKPQTQLNNRIKKKRLDSFTSTISLSFFESNPGLQQLIVKHAENVNTINCQADETKIVQNFFFSSREVLRPQKYNSSPRRQSSSSDIYERAVEKGFR
jgi:hypothetical protein